MLGFLSRFITPQTVPFFVGIAAWLYHKARGDKAANQGDLIDSVFGTLAHELVDQYAGGDVTSYLKTARAYFEARTWGVLQKRGVPKNALTQKLVDIATEKWSVWLGGQLLQLRGKAPGAPLAQVLK